MGWGCPCWASARIPGALFIAESGGAASTARRGRGTAQGTWGRGAGECFSGGLWHLAGGGKEPGTPAHSGRAYLHLAMVTNPVRSPGVNTQSWAVGRDAAVMGSGLGGALQGWEAGGLHGSWLAVSTQCPVSCPGVGGDCAQTFALVLHDPGASLCIGGWAWVIPAPHSGDEQ